MEIWFLLSGRGEEGQCNRLHGAVSVWTGVGVGALLTESDFPGQPCGTEITSSSGSNQGRGGVAFARKVLGLMRVNDP